MTVPLIILTVTAGLILRFGLSRALRLRRARPADAPGEDPSTPTADAPEGRLTRSGITRNRWGDVGTIAGREVRERVRGRIFRIGTVVVLLGVAAAIIIPTLDHHGGDNGGGLTAQRVGVVGSLSPEARQLIDGAAAQSGDSVSLVPERSLATAETSLRTSTVDLSIINSSQVVLDQPAGSKGSTADPTLVGLVAEYLGVAKAYQVGGLTPAQAQLVTDAGSVPVRTLQPGAKSRSSHTSVIGLVLLFALLTQYNTWTLIGVMQEKASRVVEVLLATVRPIQLLGGKVLGIGLVALGQASLIVAVALGLAAAVGSDALKGTAPLVLACQVLWLFLGYSFYCWAYAAAGSTAERQDQVQTLALPLSLPILVGYVFSITVVSAGHADVFFRVLAYLPPTAPFCMPVLVGLSQVSWWQFAASVLITLAATVGMAIFAARIYERSVLRTGSRVHLREILASGRR